MLDLKVLIGMFGMSLLILVSSCKESGSEIKSISAVPDTESVFLTTPDVLYPELFIDVQMGSVFEDSKTFVDCTAKFSAEEINKSYAENNSKEGFDLKSFVLDNFEIPPSISSDFKADMSKSATEHINALWPILKRESDEVTEGSTLIALPHPYIVPGGRFREVYYWDSYFTMLGLVESGEFTLIENMLDNFAYLIKTVGHIPNGNRVYYKTRSQPPFFSQMVKLYAEEKGDEVYAKYKDALIGEWKFWMDTDGEIQTVNQHVVKTDVGLVNRYFDKGFTPRQESFKEDFLQVQETKGGEKMYNDLRSGAESGWDYTSRWFADGKNINTIQTTDIIPVDLNALLYGLETIIVNHLEIDQVLKGEVMISMQSRMDFMNKYMVAEDGTFEDYNWVKGARTGIKSLAMVYPLFFKMADRKQAGAITRSIEKDFLKPGGVVTTLYNTGQQWDAPNGWAPLQWMTVKGLDNYGFRDIANDVAERWIMINEKVYQNTGKFVEKYNVEDMTLEAGGGEYPVQDGFGWSNGVYLAMKKFIKED
ncbi:MAG: alpha,alpha-trehalase [Saprospiraceae bacterium]|jgi:alpha,alpha-trehalase